LAKYQRITDYYKKKYYNNYKFIYAFELNVIPTLHFIKGLPNIIKLFLELFYLNLDSKINKKPIK